MSFCLRHGTTPHLSCESTFERGGSRMSSNWGQIESWTSSLAPQRTATTWWRNSTLVATSCSQTGTTASSLCCVPTLSTRRLATWHTICTPLRKVECLCPPVVLIAPDPLSWMGGSGGPIVLQHTTKTPVEIEALLGAAPPSQNLRLALNHALGMPLKLLSFNIVQSEIPLSF